VSLPTILGSSGTKVPQDIIIYIYMNTMATIESLSESVTAIGESIATTNGGLDVFYLLFAGAMVFFMQAGFAMLCAGSIRAKNVKNIMLKNILDACEGAVGFWTTGYAFAYGNADSSKITFIGNIDFVLENIHDGASLIGWFFQFAFAATAATIVAGTVAERCKFEAYICYSLMLTGFVYPVVVHSIWSSSGFLSAFTDDKFLGSGMIDFAGSGVVHMTGGVTALFAAKILGPRIGRFYDAEGNELPEPHNFPPHSVALQVLGTFILWVGWYGFNPGSTLGISASGYADVSALCAVTTTLAAAAGSVSAMFTDMIMTRKQTGDTTYDITMCMNGALSGLVGITAGCSVCEPWAALVIGIVAGWVYIFWSSLLVQLKIDDAVDAIPVHLGNGMWGCIATGLFASPGLVANAYGTENYGWFYNWGMGNGTGKLLADWCSLHHWMGWSRHDPLLHASQ
jgi:ammonium transporter, Amt family